MEFEEIDYHIKNDGLEKLVRSPGQQVNYLQKLEKIRNEWESISDYILFTKFMLPFSISTAGKKFVCRDFIDSSQLCVENDFPYNFADDIVHMVYWRIGGEVTLNDLRDAMKDLNGSYDVKKYALFINPPRLKSILDLSHGHIILQVHDKKSSIHPQTGSVKMIMRGVRVFGILLIFFTVKCIYQSTNSNI